ncbi:MAG: Ppx/GppA phosphatase family protein [Nitrospiraceae bacterium]
MAKLGVLDIGTNSIHLVLAEVQSDFSYKIVDRYKDMTRLGDGTFASKRLSPEAMTRGVHVIQNMVRLARNKGFDQIRAVATSAVREARNGGEFLRMVLKQAKLRVRVITGEEEARLIFLGVQHGLALPDRPVVVVDIGGGSVELVAGTRQGILKGVSLKLGAIRLADLCVPKAPPSKKMYRALTDLVQKELRGALSSFPTKRFDKIVATSGMATNLAEVIALREFGKPMPQANLTTVARKHMHAVERQLAKSSVKERLRIPGLDPRRADTLFPAATVLRVLMEELDHDELTICDKALREGILFDFVARHRERIEAEQAIPDVRRRNVMSLAQRCRSQAAHSQHIAKLALQLFDQTRSIHGLGRREREWLEYSALLHDIGYLINPRQHHKHAYYLIAHSDMSGFAAEEIEVLANVARYHRRAPPSKKHKEFSGLSRELQAVVRTLSAFLRVADALDRSQFGVVRQVDVSGRSTLTLRALTSGDAELELWAARERMELLEQVLGRKVICEAQRRRGAVA